MVNKFCFEIIIKRKKVIIWNNHSFLVKSFSAQNDVNTENRRLFQGATSSSTNLDIQSTISKASKLIEEIKSNPLARTERHSRKRKKGVLSRQFQKNLVVIDFQETELPDGYFPLRDHEKLFEGPISLNTSMTEDDIRREIVSLVQCKKTTLYTLDQMTEDDIQFVKCANRRIRVPDGNVVYDADGIKTLYRSGAIYVRLTRSFLKVSMHVYHTVCHRLQSTSLNPSLVNPILKGLPKFHTINTYCSTLESKALLLVYF